MCDEGGREWRRTGKEGKDSRCQFFSSSYPGNLKTELLDACGLIETFEKLGNSPDLVTKILFCTKPDFFRGPGVARDPKIVSDPGRGEKDEHWGFKKVYFRNLIGKTIGRRFPG